ncbi:hypothetical protein Prum_086990 [Phytohabitans rumicis]|uniref:Peroxisomal multifunctional enzyme type 2-like N-terminal domain-containing protein n=1 Tax=Phytohabitans rumicis TaxID=1076125 RepID=A0A6V8LLT9_9ACTN|nr:hypothetical protein Prum_086990 [Phytohabitans rumicis]
MSPFDLSVVDRWSDERTVEVTAAGVEAYAAVVGGPSPVYAVAPAMDLVFAVAEAAVPAELRARVVHGQEDLVFHRPLPVGEKVTLRAAVVGLHGKGSGTTATIKVETRDAAGQLVNEQYVTEFYRGVPTDLAAGSAAPPLPREPLDGPPLHTATTPLPPDLPASTPTRPATTTRSTSTTTSPARPGCPASSCTGSRRWPSPPAWSCPQAVRPAYAGSAAASPARWRPATRSPPGCGRTRAATGSTPWTATTRWSWGRGSPF